MKELSANQGQNQAEPEPVSAPALAAVTVVGHCRERSPLDLALFGEEANRFYDRFADPVAGQDLLSRCINEGASHMIGALRTCIGVQEGQVSLWRQRGGGKVRILAAFALGRRGGAPGQSLSADRLAAIRDQFVRFRNDLRAPLHAILGCAEQIRRNGCQCPSEPSREYATDIIVAAWRLRRLSDDLSALGAQPGDMLELRVGEVDPAHLVRRVLRLVRPLAQSMGVGLAPCRLAQNIPWVLADESTLWSAIDYLVQRSIKDAGQGGQVQVTLDPQNNGSLFLLIANARGDVSPGGPLEQKAMGEYGAAHKEPELGLIEKLVVSNRARLEFETASGAEPTARIVFPPERCLEDQL